MCIRDRHYIAIPKDKKGAPPFSVDDNLFHTSTEGKVLENPKNSAPEFIFQRSVSVSYTHLTLPTILRV